MGVPTLQIDGHHATIELQRPDKRNRIEPDDLVELLELFDRIVAEPDVRVVVLKSSGPIFYAGFHLGALADGTRSPVSFGEMCDRLGLLPMPSIAQIEGGIHGGGTDLALSCDFRIAADDIELVMPAARLGLQYYASGLQRFVARIGPSASKRLFLTALPADAPLLLTSATSTSSTPAGPSPPASRSWPPRWPPWPRGSGAHQGRHQRPGRRLDDPRAGRRLRQGVDAFRRAPRRASRRCRRSGRPASPRPPCDPCADQSHPNERRPSAMSATPPKRLSLAPIVRRLRVGAVHRGCGCAPKPVSSSTSTSTRSARTGPDPRRAASTPSSWPTWSGCTTATRAAPTSPYGKVCRCRSTTRCCSSRPWRRSPSTSASPSPLRSCRPTRSPSPASCPPWTT